MIICKDIHKKYRSGHLTKTVLRGVNFTINPTDRVGLLGRNGAGKSTLIKMIGGVEMPTSGAVTRSMTCSWPLGFHGAFQGSLTGYDNARFIARIYDKPYQEMREFVEEFTELGPQLRMPVKTYSSGMRARLAFSLSLAIDFDCYLIDEVIMVGDRNFQNKCRVEFFEKRKDRAIVLASHSAETIKKYCNRAIILHEGVATPYDDVGKAIKLYSKL